MRTVDLNFSFSAAEVGGLIGLIMGVSVISLLELFLLVMALVKKVLLG